MSIPKTIKDLAFEQRLLSDKFSSYSQASNRFRSKRPFTLLEMTVSLAILTMVASVMGWQVKTMTEIHRFQRHVDHLVTDLRQLQIVALSHKADINLDIAKKEGKFVYSLSSDEPSVFKKVQYGKLEGVKKMQLGQKNIDSLSLQISSTGVITPRGVLSLFQDKSGEKKILLDLTKTPLIYTKNDSGP